MRVHFTHGNGSTDLWRLPHITNVYTWRYKRQMLLLSYCEPCTRTMLMYPYGAPSVKCAVCHYITNVNTSNGRLPVPVRPNGTATSGSMPPVSTPASHSHNQTVVVENPMSVDESGKLVSNVVVGVTTEKKAIK
ncbi:hypothetical protein E3N88_41170 [Mikania micrantha]|uniref:Zinc finger LSD1-type domain-containing protein n=1 Tax=Mikania micrantha TaxID=192012 RepID=A0A5N6LPQ5_9ASTR|nr:hypothetical protein E3N88_41142 [Mikania micrantha]KAD2394193.1 hypothetical protein E3N88_41170 [Mikania micrantha]